MKPTFFDSSLAFRRWLEQNHERVSELLVGYYKRDSGIPSMTWPESVDEALCFGWIDGVRKRIDDQSYTIRFTPRRPNSIWSAVNIKRVAELQKLGRMASAGVRAFEKRREEKSAIYAYEKETPSTLSNTDEAEFRANTAAWDFFVKQAPSYRRVVIHWVVSAKKEETKRRRLTQLIEASAAGRRLR